MLLLFFEGVSIATEQLQMSLILVPFIPILFFYVFDFRGVDICLDRNKIREYRLNIFGKSGCWIDLSQFQSIYLDYDSFGVQIADFSEGGYNGQVIEKNGQFLISLVSQSTKELLIVSEKIKYHEAKLFATELAQVLSLPIRDTFQKRLRSPKRGGRK